jgi:hypothetical protein
LGGARFSHIPWKIENREPASFLEKRGYAVPETIPGGRCKVLGLTGQGHDAKNAYYELAGTIEERWRALCGARELNRLRESLKRFVFDDRGAVSPLLAGLEPYPDSWRKSPPSALPHYPMVLHRGGFPDGS